MTPSAASGESTAYDVVLYPGRAQAYSHPRRSATLARLMGFEAAPVGRCRVLELGCSNGANLAAMAVGLTESEFVGVDLSRRSIRTRPRARRGSGPRERALARRQLRRALRGAR